MSTRRSKFEGLFEDNAQHHAEPPQSAPVTPAQPADEEIKKTRNQENKKSRKEESADTAVPRVKTNYEIRQDYVRAMKRLAVDDGRKIYEVLEDAIGQYLAQRKH